MLSLTFDTSCCIDVYRQDDMPNGDLLTLISRGLINRVDLAISDVALEDVQTASAEVRPLYQRRLEMFPTLTIPQMDIPKRESLSGDLMKELFPGSPAHSASHGNNLRDCRHLATHHLKNRDIFVTLDKRLLAKANTACSRFGITVLDPLEALTRLEATKTIVGPHSVAIRPYENHDESYLRSTLSRLNKQAFLDRVRESQVVVTIGELEGEPSGIALCEHRAQGLVEVPIFHVEARASGTDLAGHLLFRLIRNWIDSGCDTARIWVPPDRGLMTILREHGFVLSAVQRRTSDPSAVELEMVKYFDRRRLDRDGFAPFLTNVVRLLSPAPPTGTNSEELRWAGIVPDQFEGSIQEDATVTMRGHNSGIMKSFGPAELEILFYPMRIVADSRRALIVPIQPHWAARMISFVGRQEQLFNYASRDPLFIRSDNAYYCYPKCQIEVSSRCPVVFYVSAPVSACVGEAKILQWAADYPEVLHAIFGELGVYELSQVRQHIKKGGELDGRALAIRFSHYVPFSRPVSLHEVRQVLGQVAMTPQGLHPISMSAYEEIRTKGGLSW